MRQVRRQLENRSRSNRLCRRSVHHRDVSCRKRQSSLKAVLFSNTLGISLRPRSQSSGRTASVTPQTFANWAAIRSWFLPFYIGRGLSNGCEGCRIGNKQKAWGFFRNVEEPSVRFRSAIADPIFPEDLPNDVRIHPGQLPGNQAQRSAPDRELRLLGISADAADV